MRKVIAAINITLDGYCDHTAILPDEELHDHYSELLSEGGVILYGRITYELMEYWKQLVKQPSGNDAMDKFARVMDNIPKIVFSRTLKSTDWESARLAAGDLAGEVIQLKKQQGNDILIGSRSLIISLLKLRLIDEFQLCIHPVIAGQGQPLFSGADERITLKLLKSKTLKGGAIIAYYQPEKTET